MNSNLSGKHSQFIRGILIGTILLHAAGLYQFITPAIQAGFIPASLKWSAASLASAILLVFEVLLLALTWHKLPGWAEQGFNWLLRQFSRLKWLNIVLLILAVAGFTFLVLSRYGIYFSGVFTRLSIFGGVSLVGCFLLQAFMINRSKSHQYTWGITLLISLILSIFVYNLLALLQDISAYPFTLGWSETSRFYYASLFLAEKIYGFQTPPSVLHPSRYLMQAAPFLLPVSPLWLHRAWQVFLWIAVSLATAAILANRLISWREKPLRSFLFMAWVFAFLMIGPVYYHLQIPLILVLWGFDRNKSEVAWKRFVKNLLIILAASLWTGISRVNWYPVPGLLAAAIIFLEQPVSRSVQPTDHQDNRKPSPSFWQVIRYGIPPVAWTILGTAVAYAAHSAYIFWSGNDASEFASSFSSDLLWYRLWPSSTYPIGILPGILLVSLPMFWAIWEKLRRSQEKQPMWKLVHPIRWAGLGAILLVLFAGGLVVSVKIGGGSNLHNMDAYLSLLLAVFSWIIFNKLNLEEPVAGNVDDQNASTEESLADYFPENTATSPKKPGGTGSLAGGIQGSLVGGLPGSLVGGLAASIAACIAAVCLFTLFSRSALPVFPAQETINRSLAVINRAVKEVKSPDPQVLFLTDRHLLTFGYIQGVKLIPEYERVFLMEMAMANNRAYLERFHEDLRTHRFDLIISEPLFIQQKGQGVRFGEENDAWVEQVSQKILCYYKPRTLIKDVRIQILIPREKPGTCE